MILMSMIICQWYHIWYQDFSPSDILVEFSSHAWKADTTSLRGPDFLWVQKLGYAQLTWHDTQNSPKSSFSAINWCSILAGELIMTSCEIRSNGFNRWVSHRNHEFKFCLTSTLGPWRPFENPLIPCWCCHLRKKIVCTNTIATTAWLAKDAKGPRMAMTRFLLCICPLSFERRLDICH